MVDTGGSGEPMSEYYSDATNKAYNGDLHDMPRVRQSGRTDDACVIKATDASASPHHKQPMAICVGDPLVGWIPLRSLP